MLAIEKKFNEDRRDNSDAERYGLSIDQVIYWLMEKLMSKSYTYQTTDYADVEDDYTNKF